MNTPNTEGIESNLEMFLQKWGNQLPQLTHDYCKIESAYQEGMLFQYSTWNWNSKE